MAITPSNVKEKGQEEFNDLSSLYKSGVLSWLKYDIKQLLLDYLTIKNSYRQFGLRKLSDYSFLLTPAFKALEGVLIQIGEELGFDLEEYNFKIGVVFSESNLEKYYNDVLNQIENLDQEYKNDIQMWLNDARRILRHFRHSPAHYLGESKSSWEEAFSFGDHILRVINEMTFSLLKSGLFEEVRKRKDKDGES